MTALNVRLETEQSRVAQLEKEIKALKVIDSTRLFVML